MVILELVRFMANIQPRLFSVWRHLRTVLLHPLSPSWSRMARFIPAYPGLHAPPTSDTL